MPFHEATDVSGAAGTASRGRCERERNRVVRRKKIDHIIKTTSRQGSCGLKIKMRRWTAQVRGCGVLPVHPGFAQRPCRADVVKPAEPYP